MIIEKLKQLEKESISRGIPIIGPVKGAWLLGKVKDLKPRKILEIGTANGYSGIILGSEGAKITTFEIDSEIAKEAANNFEEFGIEAEIIIGDANEEIKKINNKFDLIYIDHAKKDYVMVLGDCIRLCNKSGAIIADNITFEGCRDFRENVLRDERLCTKIINLLDGLSYSELARHRFKRK